MADYDIMFNNVWKSYSEKYVVKGVSFSASSGEIISLLGPNGSGKSTLFKMALGIVKPDLGDIRVGNIDPIKDPITARRIIGYVPEEEIIYESLKVVEYLEFIASIYELKISDKVLKTILTLLGLEDHVEKLIGELSHGLKRKVMIASVMMRDPKVLVLDEVFSGLDPASARVVKAWIREKARQGVSIMISTHILPIAEAVADRIIIIHNGEIVAEGRTGELKDVFGAKELEDVFLKLTGFDKEFEKLISALHD